MTDLTSTIFGEEGHWKFNAFLANGRENWLLQASSYHRAGDVLWRQILDVGAVDFLINPMLFCYRHALELQLKSIRLDMLEPNEDTTKVMGIGKHVLSTLWQPVRARTVEMDGEIPELKDIDRVVADFEMIDRDSYTFRYPVDKKHRTVLAGVETINVQSIGDRVAAAMTLLGGIGDVIWESKPENYM